MSDRPPVLGIIGLCVAGIGLLAAIVGMVGVLAVMVAG